MLALIVAVGGLGTVTSGVLSPDPALEQVAVPAASPVPQAADTASPEPPSPSPSPSPSPTPVLLRSVVEQVSSGSGDLEVVQGEGEAAGNGPLRRYIVEVEEGLPGKAADFAAAVEETLGDSRSWGHDGAVSLRRVAEGPVDFRVTLASPDTVDERCTPLRTNGYVSCFMDGRAMINQNRWVAGVPHFDGDLESYRTYVINHEVGHALGHGHVNCPGEGEKAPVMQQQTLDLQGCDPNGWVHP